MSILVSAGVVLASVALMCGVLFAVHRLGSKETFLADTTRGAGVYAVVGTSFAVLLAFVVLVAFQSFNDARNGAQAEADAVVELSRSGDFFPPAERDRFDAQLLCYARAVVYKEWPAMKDGHASPVVDGWSLAQQRTLERLRVHGPKLAAAFSDLLTLRNARQDARRARLVEATPIITAPVWFVLILGAVINIAFVLAFIDRRTEWLGAQFTLIAAITAIVVAGLLLVWFLDHPYENSTGSIKPTQMQRSLGILAAQPEGSAPVPCTVEGVPLRL